MNRLTCRPDNGLDDILYSNPTDPEGMYDILDLAKYSEDGDGSESQLFLEISERLAAYEDTGLTPEEVKDAILLPCKIGDKAWAIRSYGRHQKAQKAVEGVVSEMYFLGHRGEDMRLVVVVKNVARGLYGKAVFATRAEAEEALKGDIK